MFALLYDYLIFAIFDKTKMRKIAYYLISVSFIAYIFLAQGLHLYGIGIANKYYRIFLIEGFPFFLLGFFIHENEDKINISSSILLLIALISTLLCPLERYLMGRDFGVTS